jgi:prepilin-type N-terminal cleavage/methylation domain-containing protein
MKNTKKAFTLVELIVVITILAVLATVAFISLTGYSQEAKNSTVQAEVRTLVTAIETDMTENSTDPRDLVASYTTADDNAVAGTVDYKTGSTMADGGYDIGSVNFAVLGQSGEDFVTSDGNQYLFAAVANKYQIASEILEDGEYKAIVKGNYVSDGETDTADSLFTVNGNANTAYLTGGTVDGTNPLVY